jgi:hypothetical protein
MNKLTLDVSGAALAGHKVARAVLLDNRNNEAFYPREHTYVMLATSDAWLKGQ